jgi:hypothetical protein
MSKTKKIVIGISVAVIAIIWIVCINVYTTNCEQTEIEMATGVKAQVKVVSTAMDTMINIIVNNFKVNKKLAKDIITQSVAVAEAEASGRKGGALFKSSTESTRAAMKLGIPETTYLKMMNTIQGELDDFKSAQNMLTSKWESHQNFVLSPWHNNHMLHFGMGPRLKSKLLPEPEMITSQAVKDAQKTKTYDGTNLIPDTE